MRFIQPLQGIFVPRAIPLGGARSSLTLGFAIESLRDSQEIA